MRGHSIRCLLSQPMRPSQPRVAKWRHSLASWQRSPPHPSLSLTQSPFAPWPLPHSLTLTLPPHHKHTRTHANRPHAIPTPIPRAAHPGPALSPPRAAFSPSSSLAPSPPPLLARRRPHLPRPSPSPRG